MKLQKAIDKAKMKQSGLLRSKPVPAAKLRPAAKPKENAKPPVYSDSAAVALDEELIKENRCVCFSPDALIPWPFESQGNPLV